MLSLEHNSDPKFKNNSKMDIIELETPLTARARVRVRVRVRAKIRVRVRVTEVIPEAIVRSALSQYAPLGESCALAKDRYRYSYPLQRWYPPPPPLPPSTLTNLHTPPIPHPAINWTVTQ